MAGRKKKRTYWSAADVKALRKMAGRVSVARIARTLRRTVAAVRYKAHKKGIGLAVR